MNKKGLGLSVGIASVVTIGTLCQPHLALAEHIENYTNTDQKVEIANLRDERVKNVVADNEEKISTMAKEALEAQRQMQRERIAIVENKETFAQVAIQKETKAVATKDIKDEGKKVELEKETEKSEDIQVTVQEETKEDTLEKAEEDSTADIVSLSAKESEEIEVPKILSEERDLRVPMDGWLTANMNIRQDASTDSAILGILNLGTKVSGILSDGWLEIEYNNTTAYIFAEYISSEEVEIPVEKEPVEVTGEAAEEAEEVKKAEEARKAEEAKKAQERQAIYDNGTDRTGYTTINLNVRDNPSMDSNVIGVYPQGTKVTGKEANGWMRVDYNGKAAYIAANRVSEQQATPIEEQDENRQEAPVSGSAQSIVDGAYSFLGYRYVFGSADPSSGFDCSGLAYYLYKTYAGVTLNRSSYQMVNNGYGVSKDNLRPGDLLFFNSGGDSRISHVGIYVGDGQMIHASTPGTGVIKSSIVSGYHANTFVTARRILN
ncbi:MAG: NlpC/P60 family protein [Tissierellia bacterium]|nr:NlpC/P60 family protein [Tissierellia bacterium]